MDGLLASCVILNKSLLVWAIVDFSIAQTRCIRAWFSKCASSSISSISIAWDCVRDADYQAHTQLLKQKLWGQGIAISFLKPSR